MNLWVVIIRNALKRKITEDFENDSLLDCSNLPRINQFLYFSTLKEHDLRFAMCPIWIIRLWSFLDWRNLSNQPPDRPNSKCCQSSFGMRSLTVNQKSHQTTVLPTFQMMIITTKKTRTTITRKIFSSIRTLLAGFKANWTRKQSM